MIYPYHCKTCDRTFDVIKSVRQINDEELCSDCHKPAERTIAKPNLVAVCDWVEQYSPSLGCVIRSKAHQRKVLADYRARGVHMEPIGNEPVENVHKFYDKQRQETRDKRWREADREMLYE